MKKIIIFITPFLIFITTFVFAQESYQYQSPYRRSNRARTFQHPDSTPTFKSIYKDDILMEELNNLPAPVLEKLLESIINYLNAKSGIAPSASDGNTTANSGGTAEDQTLMGEAYESAKKEALNMDKNDVENLLNNALDAKKKYF